MMTEIIDVFKSQKCFRCRTGATEKQIKEAENKLGLTFSDEYKAYLLEFGCVSMYEHEFTGLNCSKRLDVVEVTLEQRDFISNIPLDLYVIEEANIDGIIICQNNSGEVFCVSPNSVPNKISNSFEQYVLG